MTATNVAKWSGAVGWVLTAVFGTGWYWQYKSAQLEERKVEAAALTQRLAIRDETTRKLLALLPLLQSGTACSSEEGRSEITALIGDLNEFEKQLAVLENRPPRTDLYGRVRPCPPAGLTVR